DGNARTLEHVIAQVEKIEEARREARGRLGHGDGARRRHLLHPGGEPDDVPLRRVVHAEIVADLPDDDLARVEAHPHGEIEPALAPHIVGQRTEVARQLERGRAGALGVILVGDRSAEERHDAVAGVLVDRPFVTVDAVRQDPEEAIEEAMPFLEIHALSELHRARDVGEEDGDQLALALERALLGEDLLDEVTRRVGARLEGDGGRREARAALVAEPRSGPGLVSTRFAGDRAAPSTGSRPPCILAPHAIASSRGPCREERNRSVQSAELILGLLIAVAALVTIARRLGIAYPIFLVIGGLVLGLVPGIPRIEIEPDLIFLVVLPPLLYIAAFFTPVTSLRANLGTIGSLAIGLVIATALAVAAVARALIAGMTWPVALALGAIVAPPDEIAATAIAARLGVPRRIVTILEGESLLNDATALTIYSVAIAAAVGGSFSPSSAAATFALAIVGGLAIGVAVGWVIAHIRSRIEDTPVEITISLLTPYAAFLAAERLVASGAIATGPAGLYLGHLRSRIMGADARLTGRAVWETITFLLNGFVFLVTGLEVPLLLRALAPSLAMRLIGIGLAVSLVLILVRTVWIFGTLVVPQMIRRRKDIPRPVANALVLSWAGMRGVVSLAAALALPTSLPDGGPFPAREALVIVTLTVIVFTLVGQGLTLPRLIRALHLGADVEIRGHDASARQRLLEA